MLYSQKHTPPHCFFYFFSIEIVDVTKEKNIHLVLYDFNSTDDNVKNILRDCRFAYTYHSNHGRFSKVIGLNRAVSAIEAKDPIIFVLDLQLQLPMFLFDYVRKVGSLKKTSFRNHEMK